MGYVLSECLGDSILPSPRYPSPGWQRLYQGTPANTLTIETA